MVSLKRIFYVNSAFTPDSAKSKIDEFYKVTNWVKLKTKQHHSKVLRNSFPMNGHTSIESKLRKLCITQGFTFIYGQLCPWEKEQRGL